MLRRSLAVVVVGMGLVGMVSAADPAKPEALPAPKALPAPQVLLVPGEFQMRVNRYDVWQCYGVDRFGRFRPLVVNTPWGAYYYANGACFPWTSTHPHEFLRNRVD
jgi:hypothetical protein